MKRDTGTTRKTKSLLSYRPVDIHSCGLLRVERNSEVLYGRLTLVHSSQESHTFAKAMRHANCEQTHTLRSATYLEERRALIATSHTTINLRVLVHLRPVGEIYRKLIRKVSSLTIRYMGPRLQMKKKPVIECIQARTCIP